MKNHSNPSKKTFPIGVFDSGTGGLTITHALVDAMPSESILYFGDTAHLPYGDKSASTIQKYSVKIVEMLLKRSCKLILIACNSATAASYNEIKQRFSDQVLIVNVIDPVARFLAANYRSKNVGLIGTKLTINSKIYQEKLNKLNANINICALATPLLVPIIEEGLLHHQIMDTALSEYLAKPVLNNIEALILGCTHYPLIKEKINKFYKSRIEIIDVAKIVADEIKKQLIEHDLLNQSSDKPASRHFYVSDYAEAFALQARLFFGDDVNLEYYPLWHDE